MSEGDCDASYLAGALSGVGVEVIGELVVETVVFGSDLPGALEQGLREDATRFCVETGSQVFTRTRSMRLRGAWAYR